MKIRSFFKYKLIFVIVVFIFIPELQAQTGNGNGNGNGNNTITGGADPFALTVTTSGSASLNFGSFVNVNGGAIEINPYDPNSIPTANSTGLLVVRNGTGPVLFEVSNKATPLKVVNLICQITPLSNGSPTTLDLILKFNSTRPLSSTSSTSYTFTVNELNPASIYMGGTLMIPSTALSDNYVGAVMVTIAYP